MKYHWMKARNDDNGDNSSKYTTQVILEMIPSKKSTNTHTYRNEDIRKNSMM